MRRKIKEDLKPVDYSLYTADVSHSPAQGILELVTLIWT